LIKIYNQSQGWALPLAVNRRMSPVGSAGHPWMHHAENDQGHILYRNITLPLE
jgi:hypothetical protein